MTTTPRPTLIAPLVFAGLVAALVAIFALTSSGGAPVSRASRGAAAYFLDRYTDPDGRVVRRDQGGDTVSEGQGYALLAAVGIGDRERFDRVWTWTRSHLERRDGLFSWRWQDGRVADPQPAADADLDIARALALAAWRFHDASYQRAAARTAGALLAAETAAPSTSTRVLVAGPWARPQGTVDPSYFSPAADAVLSRASGDPRLQALDASQRAAVSRLTSGGTRLASDWARLGGGGSLTAIAAPSGAGPVQYGLDAVRAPVRMAESCDRRDRALAARWWTLLRSGDPAAQPRSLDGKLAPGAAPQPAAAVGAAAAAAAAGERAEARRLLARADALDRQTPTYYGAAWVALGRLMLTTRALGGCPPLG